MNERTEPPHAASPVHHGPRERVVRGVKKERTGASRCARFKKCPA